MYLNEKRRQEYLRELNKLGRGSTCFLNKNGVFEFRNVLKSNVSLIVNNLERSKFVKMVQVIEGSYDFSHFDFKRGGIPEKKYSIRGTLNEDLDI